MIVHSPRQLISAMPHLIGFHPDNSLVVVAMDDNELLAINRLDWSSDPVMIPEVTIGQLRSAQKPSVVLIAYTSVTLTQETLIDLVPQMKEFALLDVLQVSEQKWRSLMCSDVACCPVGGHELENLVGADLDFVVAGSSPFASRDDLVKRLATQTLTDSEAELRDAALATIVAEFEAALDQASDPVVVRAEFLDRSMQIWSDQSNETDQWQKLALLNLVVGNIYMRDGLLRQMFDNPELRLPIRTSLIDSVSMASETEVAPLATVLAGCAWLDGNGALATIALERALDCDPSYSLARLLDRAIAHNVPPSVWTDSLAAVSYDECLAGAA